MTPGTLAWNGISFHPCGLPLRRLDPDSAVLGDGADAVQLRWKRLSGPFRPERHLKRLFGRGTRPEIHEGSPANGFHCVYFETPDLCGSVLHHPGSGMVVELQHAPGALPESLIPSIKDHSAGDTVPWRVFDIAARLPARWLLRSSAFRPGHFKLVFEVVGRRRVPESPKKGGRRPAEVRLERFAPADALLGKKTLAEWASGIWKKEPVPDEADDDGAVRWDVRPSLLRRMMPGTAFKRGVVHLSQGHNAILATLLRGRKPFDDDFSRITENYGIVPTEEG